MTEHRIVVEVELGVNGKYAPVGGYDQRIDFRQRAVVFLKGAAQVFDERRDRSDKRAVKVQPVCYPSSLKRLEAQHGINHCAQDFLRTAVGNLLDFHATGLACDDDHTLGSAVYNYAEIQLFGDVYRLFNEHLAYGNTFRSSLECDQICAENGI